MAGWAQPAAAIHRLPAAGASPCWRRTSAWRQALHVESAATRRPRSLAADHALALRSYVRAAGARLEASWSSSPSIRLRYRFLTVHASTPSKACRCCAGYWAGSISASPLLSTLLTYAARMARCRPGPMHLRGLATWYSALLRDEGRSPLPRFSRRFDRFPQPHPARYSIALRPTTAHRRTTPRRPHLIASIEFVEGGCTGAAACTPARVWSGWRAAWREIRNAAGRAVLCVCRCVRRGMAEARVWRRTVYRNATAYAYESCCRTAANGPRLGVWSHPERPFCCYVLSQLRALAPTISFLEKLREYFSASSTGACRLDPTIYVWRSRSTTRPRAARPHTCSCWQRAGSQPTRTGARG